MTGTNRRPLRSRQSGWAEAAARRLAAGRVTPNGISMAAVAFAAFGCAMLALSAGLGSGPRALALILAALACQGRLVCNLLDGMVAVEGGKGAKDGPFWNEAPDRASDILFFAGAGVAAGAVTLGWAAAALSVLTAYLRELGRAEGLAPDFSGPMAKQHRMAVLTGAAVLATAEPWLFDRPVVLQVALWIVVLGAALTAALRARRIVLGLKAR
ncbi:MAG: CDP-alcohol phosphatidyltransferase family protein [Paracoccaceae bacterium]|nr:CDP-alcohol phosphatidyltransferase family protein [Paracoccaceae bacterium]